MFESFPAWRLLASRKFAPGRFLRKGTFSTLGHDDLPTGVKYATYCNRVRLLAASSTLIFLASDSFIWTCQTCAFHEYIRSKDDILLHMHVACSTVLFIIDSTRMFLLQILLVQTEVHFNTSINMMSRHKNNILSITLCFFFFTMKWSYASTV